MKMLEYKAVITSTQVDEATHGNVYD